MEFSSVEKPELCLLPRYEALEDAGYVIVDLSDCFEDLRL